jgi:formate-dependent nitrite reductase membrane component NrfD
LNRPASDSYYGRAVLKPPAWHDDIAYYFFLGGLSAGSSLLGAGADLTGRPQLRRGARLGALAAIALGGYYLVHDLGRPERFLNMLRVAKPTSPMSMGTWILLAYGPGVGVAAASEVLPARSVIGRLVSRLARPAGLASAAMAPAVASYTAALLSQTAVPVWHESHPELPFIFTGSAAASAGGLGLLVAPVAEAGPARALAAYGAVTEVAATRFVERRLGLVGEVFRSGEAHRYLQRATWLTVGGAVAAVLLGRRSRVAAAVSGAALLAGSFSLRMGILRAGAASAADPKYTVGPQRQRTRSLTPSGRAGSSSPTTG